MENVTLTQYQIIVINKDSKLLIICPVRTLLGFY